MNYRSSTIVYLLVSIGILCNSIVKAQEPRLILPIGHTSEVSRAILSPDGPNVYSVSGGTLKVWDLASGRLLQELKTEGSKAYSTFFSKDGKYLISKTDGTKIKIWDIKSLKLYQSFADTTTETFFMPNSKHFVSVSKNGSAIRDIKNGDTILKVDFQTSKEGISSDGLLAVEEKNNYNLLNIWNLKINKKVFAFTHKDVRSFGFSANNTRLYSFSYEAIKVWDLKTGKLLKTISFKHTGDIPTTLSADGKKLLTFSHSTESGNSSAQAVKIWDITSGKLLLNKVVGKPKYYDHVTTCQFSADGKFFYIGYGFGSVTKFNVLNGNTIANYRVDDSSVIWSFNISKEFKKIIVPGGNTIKVWDDNIGQLLATLEGHSRRIDHAEFAPDHQHIAEASYRHTTLWDPNVGKITSTHWQGSEVLEPTLFSPDGKMLLTTPYSGRPGFSLFDSFTGANKGGDYYGSGRLDAPHAYFSPDGKSIITAFGHTSLVLVDLKGKFIKTIGNGNREISYSDMSFDGKRIATVCEDSLVKIWDYQTDSLFHTYDGKIMGNTFVQFSPDGNKIAAATFKQIKVWDINSGVLLLDKVMPDTHNQFFSVFSSTGENILEPGGGHPTRIWNLDLNNELILSDTGAPGISARFSPDGKKVATTSGNVGQLWELPSGTLISNLNGHTDSIQSLRFSADGKKIITTSEDQTMKVWNSTNGSLMYTFFAVDTIETFFQDANGYYMATPSAAKLLHYVTKDLKILSFEQLDVKYNRPDKVLEAMGSTDQQLIESYKKAYEKRIRKLNIDTSTFKSGYQIPKADFENRKTIKYEQSNATLKLHIKGLDSNNNLDRFNVWINETPIFGVKGVSLKHKSTHLLDTVITVKLADGRNQIETSIMNSNGIESYRIPLQVNYSPPVKNASKIFFVGIGIDKFMQSSYNLNWSVKDIRDQVKALKLKHGSNVVIDTLFNNNVTTEKVMAIRKRLEKSTINDKVILAYSGHGLLSKDYDYFLSTYNVDFNEPNKNGLSYEVFENLLELIPARKKLILIDACHSGEVDKEELVRIKNSDSTLAAKGVSGAKGIKILQNDQRKIGLQNSFELMNQLFANVGRGTGATIISAAAGSQFALENNNLKNGVFSYSILEFMKSNKHATVSELKKYVRKRVVELTNGLQVPSARNENPSADWEVW